jgi:primosomal protein N' (replication factor Y)
MLVMTQNDRESLFAHQDAAAGTVIRVAVDAPLDRLFDYLLPERLGPVTPGQRVRVPFGGRSRLERAFCVELSPPPPVGAGRPFRLKEVAGVVDDEPLLDGHLLSLARWLAEYYVCSLGQVLSAMVPAAVKRHAGAKTRRYVYLAAAEPVIRRARITGRRQRQVIKYLCRKEAREPGRAVDEAAVLSDLGCSRLPVRNLAEKRIVAFVEKTVLKSLPAVPEGVEREPPCIELNEDQKKALAHVDSRIKSGGFGVTLIHGVTDSGKTELYMRAIQTAVDGKKQAVVLLPEIALTAQTVQRFSERFGGIALMHSGLTPAQRNDQWRRIKAGEADVVIGARSAVFAPVSNLGLIVVDEEHEPSYKQDTAPRYNGRDVAIKRAQLASAHCILGSATPSLETLANCRKKGHFALVELPRRVMNLPMPRMRLVDMRQRPSVRRRTDLVSEPLAKALRDTAARGEQAILLLNRRGYSNLVFCPACRHTLRCRSCDVALTFHKSPLGGDPAPGTRAAAGRHMKGGFAACHHCLAETLVPRRCPLCGAALAMIGLGSQKLEEELSHRFPELAVVRVDSDSMSPGDYYRVLGDFASGRIDVLAGTQMLAKGLHFPNVTLVGIISADTCLYLPDFRTNERTFQLICQVAGRAGRSAKESTVFVQTFLPDQPAIRFALKNDFSGFIAEELKHRRACGLPPFSRLALIVLRARDFERLEAAAAAARRLLDSIASANGLAVRISGPVPAPITRIQRFHRLQIIVRADGAAPLQRLSREFSGAARLDRAVKISVDIDPVNLL